MRNKYGAIKVTWDGINFASKAEGAFYQHLKQLQRIGIITEFKCQVPYKLHAGIKWVADFTVLMKGEWIAIDVKGFETSVFKIKRKLYEEDYGPMHVVKAEYRGGVIRFNWPPKETDNQGKK